MIEPEYIYDDDIFDPTEDFMRNARRNSLIYWLDFYIYNRLAMKENENAKHELL